MKYVWSMVVVQATRRVLLLTTIDHLSDVQGPGCHGRESCVRADEVRAGFMQVPREEGAILKRGDVQLVQRNEELGPQCS